MNKIFKIIIGIILFIFIGIFYIKETDIIKYKTLVVSKEHKFAPANTAFKDDDLYKCVVYFYNNKNADLYNGSSDYGIVDTSINLTDEQLSTITRLQCDGIYGDEESKLNIENTNGIEKLTSLTALSLRGNNISSIDVSNNKKLVDLDLGINYVSDIDISKNSSLATLDLSTNLIKKLICLIILN